MEVATEKKKNNSAPDKRLNTDLDKDAGGCEEVPKFQCCNKYVFGAPELHEHLRGNLHINTVLQINKWFHFLFWKRFFRDDEQNWKIHLDQNKAHKRHVGALGGKI